MNDQGQFAIAIEVAGSVGADPGFKLFAVIQNKRTVRTGHKARQSC